MKQIKLTVLLTVLMSMVGAKAVAHDIEVANADGVTIYYNFINNNTELEVTVGSKYYLDDIVIPDEVTYGGKIYSVTMIGNKAFRRCSNLVSVNIPSSVTSIGEGAFSSCSSLSSINIPNSVTTIGQQAFEGCKGLTSITIPNSVTSIGQQAFNGCSGLTSITISNSVTTIGYSVFGGCIRLTSITIPNSVTSIGPQAFQSCSGLTSITIPNSVTSIEVGAFFSCSSLSSINIPNSVTTIGNGAFEYCISLTSVTIGNSIIGNSVTSIGQFAFNNCSSLTSVTIGNNVTSIEFGAFEITNIEGKLVEITSLITEPTNISEYAFSTYLYNNAKLYVPIGTMSKYKACEGWKNFVNIVEIEPSGIETLQQETIATTKESYTLDGKHISQPEPGLNIIRMSDGTTKKVVVR